MPPHLDQKTRDATTRHAERLTGGPAKQVSDCDTYSITCKPKMLSCDPVSQCMDFSSPGCEPLETKPK